MGSALTVLAAGSVGAIAMIVLDALDVPPVPAGILGAFASCGLLLAASPR